MNLIKPKLKDDRIRVLMNDGKYNWLTIEYIEKFLQEIKQEKDDFETIADKVIWELICEIEESGLTNMMNDWEISFIDGLSLQPLFKYTTRQRDVIKEIATKIGIRE